MEAFSVYKDMQSRTNGEIYIGVVGPVRTGKSTFIKKFMDTTVIPNIEDEAARDRAVDELPQSASGRTIMTTEPKFIPEQAVTVKMDDTAEFKVRLIDCVGFIVPSALGYIEEEQPRMVRTPWFEDPIPFNMAAEIGTQKVITEHSTIGLVITTDGSISDIPREEYEEAEARVIAELKSTNRPYIVLLNCVYPNTNEARALANELSERYNVPVLPVNCMDITEQDIQGILDTLKGACDIHRVCEVQQVSGSLAACEDLKTVRCARMDLGSGTCVLELTPMPSLFFKILGEKTGMEVADETALLTKLIEMNEIKKKFAKLQSAYDDVMQTGYGIVMPDMEELTLEEPEIIKQNGKFGIRLKAAAPSIHMMRTCIRTEVTPIVGSEQQSEDLVLYLLKEFEENPSQIWGSNIFGKSLHELVNEGMHNKLARMPEDARGKVRETIERIINDGCNGLICIIL